MSCAATISALVTGLTLASAEPVIIGTEVPFAPYTMIDEAGVITGFDYDVMTEVCTRAALSCEWETANFEDLIPGVMSGRFDVVLGGMAVTEKRRPMVDFTQTYLITDDDEWYIGRPGAPEPAEAMIAVQAGTAQHDHLEALDYQYRAFSTETEVISTVISGDADLAFGPFDTNEALQQAMAAAGLEYLYSDLVPGDGVAMAVCKGNADLLGSLNRALDAMRADGTLEKLEIRWF
jgi:polar amino acid transport system substrate-binding protein